LDLSEAHHDLASEPCLGFDACLQYPTPYLPGEWPKEYKHSGSFPSDFIWGLGTAAYQVEGAYRSDGRGASIWDTFTGADTVGMPGANCSYCCKQAPCPINEGMTKKGATGSVACDHYNMWKSDVALMKAMGLKHYRFSISWPRLVPTGKVSDGVNIKAKKFYSDLIDALVEAGITPFVTLYHWDLPQGLLDPPRINGWWSRDEEGRPSGEILPHWLDYAELCFSTFGDRVKHWVTFNEPWTFTFLASGYGGAPGISEFSNQTIDPYIAAHNVLNAHAVAVDLYRRRFQKKQGGKIGITNNCDWREPRTSSAADVAAAERAVLFQLGWFADPIFGGSGDYPLPLRRLLGDRLPTFTQEERRLINGSADFFGLNHYATGWAAADLTNPGPDYAYATISEDGFQKAQSSWLYSSAWGFRKMLNWVKRRYNNPPIVVTENGWSAKVDGKEHTAQDPSRVQYYADYAAELLASITQDGVDVRGYFAWSLMDNFEWSQGYEERFGVVYVDYSFGKDKNSPKSDLEQPTSRRQVRLRKDSSYWWEEVWRHNKLADPKKADTWKSVSSSAFHGTFFDASCGCSHSISIKTDDSTGSVKSWGSSDDCESGPRKVTVNASTIIMHKEKDGASFLLGYWNRGRNTIEWGDGTIWESAPNKLETVEQLTKGLAELKETCPGFKVCPKFPSPFEDREYPEHYEIEGTFPDDFVWGLGTAAYQVEGGYREGGRGASIWDTFSGADTVGMAGADCSYCCKEAPCEPHSAMADKGATGNVACDHFHMWRSDIALMKSMGLKHYRFSVAWPRIVPTGRIADGVEKDGIRFYSDLVDALLAEGITPYVTLYHWDLPQGLLDPPRVNGWWSRDADGNPDGQILQDWLDYVDVIFDALGDRVKYWVTFNEPWTFTWLASGWGKAPSLPEFGDQSVDPYIAAHNVLNAHAAAVHLYRTKYQPRQGGRIGITNNCDWREPKSKKPSDIAAAERIILFQLGWFADPIFGGHGDYPPEMRKMFGGRLPKFTDEQRRLINGSADFFGLNHYGTAWAELDPGNPHADTSYAKVSHDGLLNGGSGWLFGSGWGFRKMLNWVHRRYPSSPIFVTEGGWSSRESDPALETKDAQRVQYYANYSAEMHKAIFEDGVDVRGYFAWSFLDNYEWEQGYNERFGVTFTIYDLGKDVNSPGDSSEPTAGRQGRIRKDSSCWLEKLWRSNSLVEPGDFLGCAKSTDMFGDFIDTRQTGCLWTISKHNASKVSMKPVYTGTGSGCRSSALVAATSGTTIVANFTKHGADAAERLIGYWNGESNSIEWGDGSTWTKFEAVNKYNKWVFLS
jgi:beta-glucosidase/6-phospho-beta-glucosidase/beta-galactosidase